MEAPGSLGERVNFQRVKLGLSLDKLAARAGLSKDAVWRIEKHGGAKATPATVKRLADALEVSATWLLYGVDVLPNTNKIPFRVYLRGWGIEDEEHIDLLDRAFQMVQEVEERRRQDVAGEGTQDGSGEDPNKG